MLMPRCVPYQRVLLATTPAQPSWRLKHTLLEYERYVRQIPNTERFAIVGMRLIPQPNRLLSLRDLAPRDGKFLAFAELDWAVQIIGHFGRAPSIRLVNYRITLRYYQLRGASG
ncbi:hypothetical protein [Herpetosiphon giganteus]|uniref:hypothetical protein n=1 Tax=Herpetosiphon giganteus TaxID=2029754 RepID=UPI001956519F|nr:hypothetical protein [Herpetosiphon giganteus]MBM7843558.1 hypothetical protein [Herpetosiphon giganteus]